MILLSASNRPLVVLPAIRSYSTPPPPAAAPAATSATARPTPTATPTNLPGSNLPGAGKYSPITVSIVTNLAKLFGYHSQTSTAIRTASDYYDRCAERGEMEAPFFYEGIASSLLHPVHANRMLIVFLPGFFFDFDLVDLGELLLRSSPFVHTYGCRIQLTIPAIDSGRMRATTFVSNLVLHHDSAHLDALRPIPIPSSAPGSDLHPGVDQPLLHRRRATDPRTLRRDAG